MRLVDGVGAIFRNHFAPGTYGYVIDNHDLSGIRPGGYPQGSYATANIYTVGLRMHF